LLFSGCETQNGSFLVGDRHTKRELRTLLSRLDKEQSAPESRFIINNQIINIYFEHGAYQKMNLFLTTYVTTHPDDQYNAYYLLLVAENYKSAEAYPFAVHYFERVLKNYSDLLLEGNRSVHYICLSNLVSMVDEPEIRVNYYKELLERFRDNIDKGATYYHLAKTYEELGKWDLAMQHFKEYLKYPETSIPGKPNAREQVTSAVAFYDMPRKNWTEENLDRLVTIIRDAIWRKNIRRLNALRSGVGFFVRAWEDGDSAQELELLNDLTIFFEQGKTIRSSAELDRDSNEKEAYLRTTGWGHRIPTWYLYFRMVDFPADPDIHGEWEWAGIYLGEKPY
jgi:tetratricopeptide (TPR) repeat protein